MSEAESRGGVREGVELDDGDVKKHVRFFVNTFSR